MSLAPLGRLRGVAQAAAVCCLLGGPVTYVFEVKSEEGEGARIARENRKPIVRHALVTANLDRSGKAPAIVDGEAMPVVISAPPDAPTDLKDRTILVFFSTARNCWRFVSDNPAQLDTRTMDLIEAFPGRELEVAKARQSDW